MRQLITFAMRTHRTGFMTIVGCLCLIGTFGASSVQAQNVQGRCDQKYDVQYGWVPCDWERPSQPPTSTDTSVNSPSTEVIDHLMQSWADLYKTSPDAGPKAAAAAANARALGRIQSQEGADTEVRLQNSVQRKRAEDDSKRGQIQTSLIAAPPRTHSSEDSGNRAVSNRAYDQAVAAMGAGTINYVPAGPLAKPNDPWDEGKKPISPTGEGVFAGSWQPLPPDRETPELKVQHARVTEAQEREAAVDAKLTKLESAPNPDRMEIFRLKNEWNKAENDTAQAQKDYSRLVDKSFHPKP
jgi:hypothetical protein